VTLSKEAKGELLRIARTSIDRYLRGHAGTTPPPEHASLRDPCGVFVTLKRDGELRGCIGYPEAVMPLDLAVAEAAMAAATRDPRFPPVSEEEVASLSIDISVLSPVVAVGSVDEIIIGKHGLVIREGERSGLLLPQVAVEQNMDRDSFLSHTCVKAGLSPSAWREGASIFVFTAEVFSDRDANAAT